MWLIASGMGGLADFAGSLFVVLVSAASAVVAGIIGGRALRPPVAWAGVRKAYVILAVPYVLAFVFLDIDEAMRLVVDMALRWGSEGVLATLNPLVAVGLATAAVARRTTVPPEPRRPDRREP